MIAKITRLHKLRRISNKLSQGFISPEGQFVDFGTNETHSELAMQILKEKNLFQDFFKHKNDEYIWGSALKYLLKFGWIRIAEAQEGHRNALNIEAAGDLSTVKQNVGKVFSQYFGKVNADVNNVFFSGSMEEFLRWTGKEQMIQRYSKIKKKAEQHDYWFINNKLYDASEAGHVEVVRNLLESDPDVDPETLDNLYNSSSRFRTYALEELDAIRIAQDQVEVASIDSTKLGKIRKAFLQIYEDAAFDLSIGIQVNNNKTYYSNIPFEKVDSDLPLSELREYKMYNGKIKKADFGGMFQNISDLAPDPGNVAPGKNNEVVKQQEDFYPRKISDGENGEFVHTHPEHCPRPDLRKLKIADPDVSECEFSKGNDEE
ncbi:MAG: hypothetical protein WC511_02710 [Candidatus Pacearchaeota archaeon]